jgi:5-methylcytosine-specific restriction endonuclease McrA
VPPYCYTVAVPYRDREQQRQFQREWVARRRAEWFADKECVRCGSTDRLELDHIDPSTKQHKKHHNVWSWSPARRDAEIAKCQVLCHECHVAKTQENGEFLTRVV